MKDRTRVTTVGRHPEDHHGVVNPPVYHASTIVFPTLDALEHYERLPVTYGRRGTPGTYALEEAMCELEGGALTVLTPSGLSACTIALLACLDAGDHLLLVDSCYDPTRTFADTFLARMGIETTYYDPHIGAGISELIRPETRAIFLETPGSRTFEMQDVPAIVAAAREHPAIHLILDNTWGTPLYFKPLDFGIDISVQAATKYIVGHSDAMLGTVTANRRAAPLLKAAHRQIGLCAGPDDVYLALRGLRTLAVRLKQHWETGIQLASWLRDRSEVTAVYHPALEGDWGHLLWKRDFRGASGLFSIVLQPGTRAQLAAFLDHMELFSMGWSWGGYESLIVPVTPKRTVRPWNQPGTLLRLHAGLEDVGDLKADLEAAFARWHRAGG